MDRTVVSAFDPDAGDRAPVALAQIAAQLLAALLVVVIVRPGGSAAERLSRLEQMSGRTDAVAGMRAALAIGDVDVEVREIAAPSPAAGLHAVLAAERPLLAVLGSSRRGAHATVVLGRTSERVVDGAPCPVAIAPRQQAPRSLRRITVAMLPSPEGRAALQAATRLAVAAGAALHILIVLAGTPRAEDARAVAHELAPGAESPRSVHDASGILAAAITAATSDAGVDIEPSVLVGDPADALLRASQRSDLLVLGSRAYGASLAVSAGGVAGRVLAGARCPVLIIPRGDPAPPQPAATSARTEHVVGV